VNEALVRAVLETLADEMRKTAAIVRLAESGLRQVAEQIKGVPLYPENPDPLVLVGPGDPNDAGVQPSGQLKRSELMRYAERQGEGAALLEQMWIVSTYSRWENHFRHLIAQRAGVNTDQVQSKLFGDLRHRRIDIIHHNALARREHSGRTIFLPRTRDGATVRMTDEDFILALASISVDIIPAAETAIADVSGRRP